jgi:hypothetical protein
VPITSNSEMFCYEQKLKLISAKSLDRKEFSSIAILGKNLLEISIGIYVGAIRPEIRGNSPSTPKRAIFLAFFLFPP